MPEERCICAGCRHAVYVIPAKVQATNGTIAVVTFSCRNVGSSGHRCSMPTALVMTSQGCKYVFAQTFPRLEQEVVRQFGKEAGWTTAK